MRFAYIDACIWITLVEGLPNLQQPVRNALQNLAQDGWLFCTSDAVRLEVLIGSLRRKDEALTKIYSVLLDISHILTIPPTVFSDAIAIAETEGLKAMDAVHIAIATYHKCECFVTTDSHFKQLKCITPYWINLENSSI